MPTTPPNAEIGPRRADAAGAAIPCEIRDCLRRCRTSARSQACARDIEGDTPSSLPPIRRLSRDRPAETSDGHCAPMHMSAIHLSSYLRPSLIYERRCESGFGLARCVVRLLACLLLRECVAFSLGLACCFGFSLTCELLMQEPNVLILDATARASKLAHPKLPGLWQCYPAQCRVVNPRCNMPPVVSLQQHPSRRCQALSSEPLRRLLAVRIKN